MITRTSGEPAARAAPGPRRWLARLFRYAVGLGILAVIFNRVPLSDVIGAIGQSEPPFLLGALVVSLISQWLVAYRLSVVINAFDVAFSTRSLFAINAATRFYGLFLPGGNISGIAVRFYKITRNRGKYAEVAVTLYSERVISTITLCLVGLVFL